MANYERIGRDHVNHFARTGANPFIGEALWQEIEGCTASLLRKYGRPGARVLDVGCGLGRVLGPFTQFERHGMDISPDYLALAQGKGIEVCLSRIEDMPYAKQYFDIVICTDVLEHVLDFHDACRQLLGVVRDNGVAIVRVPYRENLAPYRTFETPYAFAHLRNFDEDVLALAFEKIHHCQVLEFLAGPYDVRHSTFKGARFEIAGLGFAFRLLVRAARVFGRAAQQRLLEWAFDPIEINVVIEVHGD